MAAELNADLQWAGVPEAVKRTFKGARMKRVRLEPGTLLFTLNQRRVLSSSGQADCPVFWSPYKPYLGDPGYAGRLELAASQRLSKVELFRAMSAYSGYRPGGRFAVVGKLRLPTWGFFGPINQTGRGGTSAKARGNILNIGQTSIKRPSVGYHIYIPGLSDPDFIQRVMAHDLFVR